MRRRLYFVLPNIRSAQAMMNELLLERIDEDHIHFHAKNEQVLGNLPKANAVEKSDVVYSALAGFVFGALVVWRGHAHGDPVLHGVGCAFMCSMGSDGGDSRAQLPDQIIFCPN